MTTYLLFASLILLICLCLRRLSARIGLPALFSFLLLGMLFGSDSPLGLSFDNYELAKNISEMALLLIMFFGGFGTRLAEARPVLAPSLLLSSLGTFVTAGLCGLFCAFVFHLPLLQGMLIGAVLASTDAASVFAVLRNKNLNLKNHTASILEIESGSNDPFAYTLTILLLSLLQGEGSLGGTLTLFFQQFVFGTLTGLAIAFAGAHLIRRFQMSSTFLSVFVLGLSLLSFSLADRVGANAFLSVYLTGIVLGNVELPHKREMVAFFDGLTEIAHMLLFFVLGMLAAPSDLLQALPAGLLVALFLLLVARPIASALILKPFGSSMKQIILISFAGLRGAASILFAIVAVLSYATTPSMIFHIVFAVVLVSVGLQGTLLPKVAEKLDMIDETGDVRRSFSDYAEVSEMGFLTLTLTPEHPWAGEAVSSITLPPGTLLTLLIRGDSEIVPNGGTRLQAGDILLLGGLKTGDHDGNLQSYALETGHAWLGRRLSEIALPKDCLVVGIRRDGKDLVPGGETVLEDGDLLVFNRPASSSGCACREVSEPA